MAWIDDRIWCHPKRRPIRREVREFVLDRDSRTCRYCGSVPRHQRDWLGRATLHVDHVIPVVWSARYPLTFPPSRVESISNLVTACASCNLRKGAQRWQPTPLKPTIEDIAWIDLRDDGSHFEALV